ITPDLDRYPNGDILWCQEEPLNNGVWTYVDPRILTAAGESVHHRNRRPLYAGRAPTSSVVMGHKGVHKREIEIFVNEAFSL
ncbi:hypothetical protein JB92DRAFT_2773297, partial [Gautieria morchelliformis]